MGYFPRISPNSLKISPKFRANILIQRPTYVYLFIITISFLLHLREHLSSFNSICWTHICGKYFLNGSFLEKCGKIWKNGRFSGRLRPDWGNTTRAATAGYGSIGIIIEKHPLLSTTVKFDTKWLSGLRTYFV